MQMPVVCPGSVWIAPWPCETARTRPPGGKVGPGRFTGLLTTGFDPTPGQCLLRTIEKIDRRRSVQEASGGSETGGARVRMIARAAVCAATSPPMLSAAFATTRTPF